MLLFTFASCEPIRSNNLSQYLDQQAIEAPGDTFAILFEQYVSQKMHACDCPGAAVTIISDSLVRSIKGYGVRSTLSCDTVDVHTLFRLASVSKSFGAVLTDIEVRKGLLSFADPVHRYLPEFELSDSAYTGKVTVIPTWWRKVTPCQRSYLCLKTFEIWPPPVKCMPIKMLLMH